MFLVVNVLVLIKGSGKVSLNQGELMWFGRDVERGEQIRKKKINKDKKEELDGVKIKKFLVVLSFGFY